MNLEPAFLRGGGCSLCPPAPRADAPLFKRPCAMNCCLHCSVRASGLHGRVVALRIKQEAGLLSPAITACRIDLHSRETLLLPSIILFILCFAVCAACFVLRPAACRSLCCTPADYCRSAHHLLSSAPAPAPCTSAAVLGRNPHVFRTPRAQSREAHNAHVAALCEGRA